MEVEIGGGYNKRGLDHSKEVTRSLQLLPSSLTPPSIYQKIAPPPVQGCSKNFPKRVGDGWGRGALNLNALEMAKNGFKKSANKGNSHPPGKKYKIFRFFVEHTKYPVHCNS